VITFIQCKQLTITARLCKRRFLRGRGYWRRPISIMCGYRTVQALTGDEAASLAFGGDRRGAKCKKRR